MNNYNYKCTSCQKTFLREEIEGFFQYLCPDCGKTEKNKPLQGVMLIEYGYSKLSDVLVKSQFLKNQPGQFWMYPQLWPLESEQNQIKNISCCPPACHRADSSDRTGGDPAGHHSSGMGRDVFCFSQRKVACIYFRPQR